MAREMGNVGTIELRWAAYGMRVGNMGRWGLTLPCLTKGPPGPPPLQEPGREPGGQICDHPGSWGTTAGQ